MYNVALAYVAARAIMNRAASHAAPRAGSVRAYGVGASAIRSLVKLFVRKDLSQGDKDDLHPLANSRSKRTLNSLAASTHQVFIGPQFVASAAGSKTKSRHAAERDG